MFETPAAKEAAIVDEIRLAHASGRPVLVGTASVRESESLSRRKATLAVHDSSCRMKTR